MEKKSCPECNFQFFGRKNQIYCSVECKNKSHNLKTRLIYISGRYGEDKINEIQQTMRKNSHNLKVVSDEYQIKTQEYRNEIDGLRTEYQNLKREYEELLSTVNKLKAKTATVLMTRIELDNRVKAFENLGKVISPIIDRIADKWFKLKL